MTASSYREGSENICVVFHLQAAPGDRLTARVVLKDPVCITMGQKFAARHGAMTVVVGVVTSVESA